MARSARSVVVLALMLLASSVQAAPPDPATFSIVAADPEAGEVGVAVASRFFAVGTVVPHARAGAGAVATQAYANTTYGPRGLDLLGMGLNPSEVIEVLTRSDRGAERRQVGVVDASGHSATFTGPGCNAWAGGRSGPGYAVQGNILVGEPVVAAMEASFTSSAGLSLAERLLAALAAGDDAGGDARGHQSAALVVVRAGGGYGGFSDRAIDIRVDDSREPFAELKRLLGIAMVNDDWNRGWTAFTEKRFGDARQWQERAAGRAAGQPEILPEVLYDLAVIRLADGDRPGAEAALAEAVKLNPKLAEQAKVDGDLAALRAPEE